MNLDDEDELIHIGGDSADSASPEDIKELEQTTDDPASGGQGNDAKVKEDGEDDEDDAQRAKASEEEQAAGTESEKAAIRERERQRRMNQRQRKNQRIDTLERQLANSLSQNQELHNRISQLENTNVHTQYAQLEAEIQKVANVEQQLKDILADAAIKQDGTRVAEATAAMMELSNRKAQLMGAREHAVRSQQQARRPQAIDPEAAHHATEFLRSVPWYKGTRSSEQDSIVVSSIDKSMSDSGWDPKSPSYWAELKSRVQSALPHRFEDPENGDPVPNDKNKAHNPQRKAPKSPVAGGNSNEGGGERSPNPSQYRISAARVEAMRQAGIWQDPKRREKMIKVYQEQDRRAASGN